MKKFISLILIITTLLTPLTACDSVKRGIVSSYISALDSMDFEAAYDCIYIFNKDDISKEDYTSAYQNLVNALLITDISIPQYKIGTDENGNYVKYTAELTSSYTEEPFIYEYTARIVTVNDESGIEFGYHLVLPTMEEGDRITAIASDGTRGEILSSDREVLAESNYADTVYLYVPDVKSINTTLSELSEYMEFDSEKLKKQYETAVERNYGKITVKAFPRNSITEVEKEKLTAIPGVRIDRSSITAVRYYPLGAIASHVVGYMGSPDEETQKELVEQGYPQDIKVGMSGLEKTFEDTLRGQDGMTIQMIDSFGHVKEVIYEDPVEKGNDLVLTIDSQIQTYAYYLLAGNLKSDQSGCVIVMDASTGDVDAMVSYPSFDSNLFSFTIDAETWEKLTGENSNSPLYNRATQGQYAPGSTLKPFTAVPALEKNLIRATTVFPYEIINNKWTPNEKGWIYPPVSRSRATPGELNLISAIRSSDNIYFGWVALELGDKVLTEYFKRIGIGETISFDIDTNPSNLINEDTEMNRKLLSDMGFGQGEILVTPIQLASMYSAFVNDGDMVAPNLVESVCAEDGTDYIVKEKSEVSWFKTDTIQTYTNRVLTGALEEVVKTGTAHPLRSAKYTVAAKTGTARVGSKGNITEINWVVGFWPEIDETKIILVMIESAEDEGDVKFDVIKPLFNPSLYGIEIPKKETTN